MAEQAPPRRLMVVSSALAATDAGGIASYTRRLVDILRDRGWKIVVIVAQPPRPLAPDGPGARIADIVAAPGSAPVHRLTIDWRASRSPYGSLYDEDPHTVSSMGDIIRQAYPDLVHCTSSLLLGGSAVRAAVTLGRPIVATLTDSWWICPKGSLLRGDGSICAGDQDGLTCARCMFPGARATEILQRLPRRAQDLALQALRRATRVDASEHVPAFMATVERRRRRLKAQFACIDRAVAPSRYLRQVYLEAGMGDPERIAHVPHGVDRDALREGAHKTASPRLRFGFTSRLHPDKGADLLLEAFSRLPAGRAELHLWGRPEGELRGWGMDRLTELPNVILHDAYDERDVAGVLRQIDVVVLPSRYPENAPLVISEAFAACTPVIVADAGGMAELVADERGGLRFTRGDAEDLRRAMLRLVDEPGLVHRLKSTIPEVPGLADEAARLVEIYTEVCERRQNRQGSASIVERPR